MVGAQGMAGRRVRYDRGDAEDRPWGRWEVIDTGANFAVKRITVKPGARLSLQFHHHRSEHWVIVSGEAQVDVGGVQLRLGVGGTIFVPTLAHHRLANPGEEPLVVVEVQVGPELDEQDIVRLADDYAR